MSWLKLKSTVNESVCRRKLEIPGEYSFVLRTTSKEYRTKAEMLDVLKADEKIWETILGCKMVKEDMKSFEKKVKNQFSLMPFEDIVPEPENGEKKKGDKDSENSGNVVEMPLSLEDMDVDGGKISNGKSESNKTLANGKNGTANGGETPTNGKEANNEGKETPTNGNEAHTNGKESHSNEKKAITNGNKDAPSKVKDTPSKDNGTVNNGKESLANGKETGENELDKTMPFVGSGVDTKVPEAELDKTVPYVEPKETEAMETEDVSAGVKRKKKPKAGPASRVKKSRTDDTEDSTDEENVNVEVKYDSVLKLKLKIGDTDEDLLDSKYSKACDIERNVLTFNLDKSKTEKGHQDCFKKFDNFESAQRIRCESDGKLVMAVYIVTFADAEGAEDFVEVEDDPKCGIKVMGKVGMRKYVKDKHFQHMVSRGKVYQRMIDLIEAKMDFATRKKSGVTQANCVSVRVRTTAEIDVKDEGLLDNLPEVVEEVEMYRHHDRVKDFMLVFDSEKAAKEYSEDKSNHKIEGLPMNVLLLSNMMTRMRFNKKTKHFKDDGKYLTNDNGRRVAIPLMDVKDCTKKLDAYFRAKYPKFECVHRCIIPQQAGTDMNCNLYIATFKDKVTAAEAINVADIDTDIVQRPELVMLLTEYLELRGEALKRDEEIQDKDSKARVILAEDDNHMELEWEVQEQRNEKMEEVTKEEIKGVMNKDTKKVVIEEKKKEVVEEDKKTEVVKEDKKKEVAKEDKKKEVVSEEKKKEEVKDDKKKEVVSEEKKVEVKEDKKKVEVKEDKKKVEVKEDKKKVVVNDEGGEVNEDNKELANETKVTEVVKEIIDTEAVFKSFVGCDGFRKKDKDCDIEEYFAQNHENVKQVWQRPAAGPTSKVYLKFQNIEAAENFFTLNYVKYRGRTIRPFRLHSLDKKIRDDLAKYLLADD